MISIDKLSIQGIRSFNPREVSTIDFYKPLTIIVGHNGAGKTTIIECLLYAATGEKPPNSSQSFVHDPKVAGETKVKGQVKMVFKTVKNKPFIVTRSLELSQKANKQTIKTLDSSIQTYDKNNNPISQSYKCADIDKQIPELMGVSKAILESVIFCHQEESTWPLGDPKTLKKKFDDIFASTRYTKAIEVLRKQKKEMVQSVKEQKLKLEIIQKDKEAVLNLVNEMKEIKKKIERVSNASNLSNEEYEKMENEYKEVCDLLEKNQNEILQLNKLQEITKEKKLECERMKKNMKEVMEDSDNALFEMANNFDSIMQNLKNELEESKKNKSANEKAIHLIQEKRQNESRKYGDLNARVKDYKNKISQRNEKIKSFNSEFKLNFELEDVVTDENVKDILESANKIKDALQSKLDELNNKYSKSMKELESKQEKLTQLISDQQSEIKQKKSLNDKNNKSIIEKRNSIKETQNISSKISSIEEEHQKLKKNIEIINKEFNEESYQKLVLSNKKLKNEAEEKLQNITKSISNYNSQIEQRTKHQFNLKTFEEKQKQYQQSFKEYSDCVENLPFKDKSPFLLKENDDPKNLLENLQKMKIEKTKELNFSRKEFQTAQTNFSIEKKEHENITKKIQQKQNREKEIKKKITSYTGENEKRSVNELIEQTSKQLVKVKSEIAALQSTKALYSRFIEITKHNEKCPLCLKKLETPKKESKTEEKKSVDSLVSHLEQTLKENPEQISKQKKLEEEIQFAHKKLSELRNESEEMERISSTELPSLEQDLKNSKEKMETLEKTLNSLISKQKSIEEESEKINASLDLLKTLSSHFTQLKNSQNLLQISQKTLKNDDLSIETLNQQFSETQSQLNKINKDLENLNKEIEVKKNQIYTQQKKLQETSNKLLEAKNAEGSITSLLKEIDSLEEENKTLLSQIEKTEESLSKSTQEKEKLKTEKEKFKESAENKISKYRNNCEKFKESLKSITSISSQVFYSQLLNLENELKQLETLQNEDNLQLENLKSQMEQNSSKIEEINKKWRESGERKLLVDQNVSLRKTLNNLKEDFLKMKEIKENLGNLDIDSLNQQKNSLHKQLNTVRSRKDQLNGAKLQLDSDLSKKKKEIKNKDLSKIFDSYKKQIIQLKTTDLAVNDIQQYTNALDKALMTYHQIKMEEINKIIKEYWQQTYKGNDIDTIEIRSDCESGRSNTFQYKVIMVKGEIELEMRGRCSAGQKMLASIIIRIAISEAFCINCGILALDEPTTNLDRDNIESLSKAVSSIIETRKKQRNFQLIVITHDEEFVGALGKSEFAESYFMVGKDNSNYSKIIKKDISDLE